MTICGDLSSVFYIECVHITVLGIEFLFIRINLYENNLYD
jgi:hypothetical protein